MMKWFIATISIFFIVLTHSSFSADCVNHRVIIKFKKNSTIANKLLQNRQITQIQELEPILGDNTANFFVNPRLISSISKRTNHSKSIVNKLENLQRIIVIDYSENISPELLAAKLSSLPFIEYAEPQYIKKIEEVPNDSLLGQQNYLGQIRIFQAWDSVSKNEPVVVGIVDTGVDMYHPDLSENIFINLGEYGDGKDTNGIDDDGNGFVDDWHGWDFASSSNVQDNEPMPGDQHGTHVAGIVAAVINNKIGIAGVAQNTKILPIKVTQDPEGASTIFNGYDGIFYAASMGADVINCSWGSSVKSLAELEVLDAVVAMGSVVVAASGNTGDYIAFYPAAHEDVLSVAAVSDADVRASFSNFHPSVGVSAPGVGILSTIPNSEYVTKSGTSMASPVVAGVAAIVKQNFPNYSPLQIIEQIKACSDNIDSLNPNYIGWLGIGRVNAFKAIITNNARSIKLQNFSALNQNNSKVLAYGDTVLLDFELYNILSPLHNASVHANFLSNYDFKFIDSVAIAGTLGTLESTSLNDKISFLVPDNLPINYTESIILKIYDDSVLINTIHKEMTFCPSYRTMRTNNIAVTFNNCGNIGFNDYPSNNQGEGFTYKNSDNLLFEGGLIVATGYQKLSNVVRGYNPDYSDKSFYSETPFSSVKMENNSKEIGSVTFQDAYATSNAGVSIAQTVYQFNSDTTNDFVLFTYDVTDTSGVFHDSLYVALFLDWDIGASGAYNIAAFNKNYGYGYCYNIQDTSLPIAGAAMISSQELNFFALENNGDTYENPGLWDGFSAREKWRAISSGIYRKKSSISDASMVIGAGPISVGEFDTTRVAFALFAGDNDEDLLKHFQQAKNLSQSLNIADGNFAILPKKDSLAMAYPNPFSDGILTVQYHISKGTYASLSLINYLGQEQLVILPKQFITAGRKQVSCSIHGLAQGFYLLRLSTLTNDYVLPLVVVR